MKFSQSWLESLVGDSVDSEFLLERLTLAGLEVDGHETLSLDDNVVVARVEQVEAHPDADKLRVCQVNDGEQTFNIVCGAPNVRADMNVALARIGSKLPGGLKIRKSKLRGVESQGMLCSGRELGLGEDHDGILDLADNAEVGSRLSALYALPDTVVDVDLTPNRGDCFSLLGIAREVAAFSDQRLEAPKVVEPPLSLGETYPVDVQAVDGAPVFTARVVRGIDPTATTPLWMAERLRRSGVRTIHPVVDITNYVMLEFGQPMHAYDLDKLSGAICVRRSSEGERLVLLDGRDVALETGTLAITDDSGPIGLAGIMGGDSTAVVDSTTNILFEAAWFAPSAMAGEARKYGLHTDASMRFERGVDPENQVRAQNRALELITEIAGGQAGPIVVVADESTMPKRAAVTLRHDRLNAVLGVTIAPDMVNEIFHRLTLDAERIDAGWRVSPPAFRFDIAIEEDLVEEVARVYGYDRIPTIRARGDAILASAPEATITEDWIRDALAARGLCEVISYSFVDPALHSDIDLAPPGPELLNPISKELSVMRGSLLPGLLSTAAYNMARQQPGVRLFEMGHVFRKTKEPNHLAVLLAGAAENEHWDAGTRTVDFFDVKQELEILLAALAPGHTVHFVPLTESAALHPGRAAQILLGEQLIGYVGMLHPALAQARFEGRDAAVFEINLDVALNRDLPIAQPISRYPSVRRDLSVLVDESVSAQALLDTIARSGGDLLHNAFVFDIYRGQGVEAGLKSVALGLILLDSSSTLTDEQTAATVDRITVELEAAHGAKVRE